MYGLILSVLIFTDIFNNILLYVSQYGYGIWSYIIIYYIISILYMICELLFFSTFKFIKYLDFIINKFKLYGLIYSYFSRYTKMNIVIGYRNDYTWSGQIILNIISILIPEKKTFHEEWMSVEVFSKGRGFMSGRIAYFKPLEKTDWLENIVSRWQRENTREYTPWRKRKHSRKHPNTIIRTSTRERSCRKTSSSWRTFVWRGWELPILP